VTNSILIGKRSNPRCRRLNCITPGILALEDSRRVLRSSLESTRGWSPDTPSIQRNPPRSALVSLNYFIRDRAASLVRLHEIYRIQTAIFRRESQRGTACSPSESPPSPLKLMIQIRDRGRASEISERISGRRRFSRMHLARVSNPPPPPREGCRAVGFCTSDERLSPRGGRAQSAGGARAPPLPLLLRVRI